jgi:hypothetical protein
MYDISYAQVLVPGSMSYVSMHCLLHVSITCMNISILEIGGTFEVLTPCNILNSSHPVFPSNVNSYSYLDPYKFYGNASAASMIESFTYGLVRNVPEKT